MPANVPAPHLRAMETVLLTSLWGFAGSLEEAITRARRHGFDGLEANLRHPALAALPLPEVAARLADAGLALVVELVSGGDYGFRESSGKLHEYCPDVVPPLVNVGPGSPTASRWCTSTSAWWSASRWQRTWCSAARTSPTRSSAVS